ncbi:hypothetical protein GGX14DRAFT_601723 [Mycena pura]|uniref:Uncharacterized protein n=1 Tax=Mycena pura TaxID=153505 RepID=A0AAD6VUR5_9AGAR|nr:hypothetical protein GGX14DRAFT_601723 [Mycena pura]
MSYAQVAGHNAPPVSEQPQPDPALWNTTAPSSSPYIDSTKKVNVVPMMPAAPHDDSHSPAPGRRPHSRLDESKAEGIYLWESAKHYLFRPGVAGGLLGLVNVGLMAGAARAFYVNPHYRRDTTVISSVAAAALALLSVEGYAAEAYRETAAGREEERKARKEGALIYRHVKERILRPGTLGGLVGAINIGILSAVAYVSYENWNRPWDRRIVSSVCAALFTLSLGEGFLAETYRK